MRHRLSLALSFSATPWPGLIPDASAQQARHALALQRIQRSEQAAAETVQRMQRATREAAEALQQLGIEIPHA
jgi:hypothetical protein